MTPESDATLTMTLTRTATLSSEPSASNDVYLSWEISTLTTQMVLSSAVTYVVTLIATLQETSTPSSPTSTTSPFTNTLLALQEQTSPVSSSSNVILNTPSGLSSSLQFGDIPTTSNSTQVGIAVGVPIAIFAVFFIALGMWYFLHLRRSKRELSQDLDTFSQKLNFSNQHISRPSWETLTEKPYPVIFSPTNYLLTDKNLQACEEEEPKQGTNIKAQFNRSSQLWLVRDRDKESLTCPESNFFKRMSAMTPMFLKKFNISGMFQGNKKGTKSQVLDVPTTKAPNYASSGFNPQLGFNHLDNGCISSDQNMYNVIKPYTRALDDELTIRIGDKCIVLEKFSDEWCKIQLHRKSDHDSSQKVGLVPWMCLQNI
ncbi:FUS1 [Candida margitis]|uniref:FUS1 n=1 Tax=Candida margitis TaxID=1775924 RepID=UPI002227F43B|nr:FUS1 [Candida margitis]KAI5969721.1 FUS1 [Candida margitis]